MPCVDLVMIHGPGVPENFPYCDPEVYKTLPKTPEGLKESRIEMWRALQQLKAEGKIKHIGVSNFNTHHIEQLIADPR